MNVFLIKYLTTVEVADPMDRTWAFYMFICFFICPKIMKRPIKRLCGTREMAKVELKTHGQ